ncbi:MULTISPECIES: hypothetical protein [Sulfitobacter]|uniref:Transcriptional regulator n=1 Tax=Sulfitobacter profundi TaxID=2679961 RepID=A0ABW1YUE1_9RHOB|nr:hypothetical protein [Sulfitobacter indolifex]
MSNISPIAPALAVFSLPTAGEFRTWTATALAALELTPTALARELDLGKNSIQQFLAGPSQDIRLGNAARIHASLVAQARARGVALPPVVAHD